VDRAFWHKQTADEPLFPDLLWSRPENKAHAGKLLVAGGSSHGFAAPAEAYSESQAAGAGLTRVLLPLSVKRLLPRGFIEADFAAATPSGSFSQQALGELLDASAWADAVLLAGDFGHNSETAILLERFAKDYTGQLTMAGDAIDYFTASAEPILNRKNTLLILGMARLQKLAKNAGFPEAFTSTMDLLRLIDTLHDFTGKYPAHIIVRHAGNVLVAVDGQVSTAKLDDSPSLVATAAHAAVWWLQNPTKSFEALSTSIIPAGR